MLRGPDHIAMRTGACIAGPSDCVGEIASTHRRQVVFAAGTGEAIRRTGRTLDFALREARETGRHLYLLFVREQLLRPSRTPNANIRRSRSHAEFRRGEKHAGCRPPLSCYAVSESAAEAIADIAATLGASRLILGAPRRNALINILRGNLVREVSDLLPEEIDLLVYA